jgi:hypothetical protein
VPLARAISIPPGVAATEVTVEQGGARPRGLRERGEPAAFCLDADVLVRAGRTLAAPNGLTRRAVRAHCRFEIVSITASAYVEISRRTAIAAAGGISGLLICVQIRRGAAF